MKFSVTMHPLVKAALRGLNLGRREHLRLLNKMYGRLENADDALLANRDPHDPNCFVWRTAFASGGTNYGFTFSVDNLTAPGGLRIRSVRIINWPRRPQDPP